MNKPVCFGLSILELSRILIYEFWYDCVKLKYGEKIKLPYMETDSFIVNIKTDNIHKDIIEDVETIFDTSNDQLDHWLKEKQKNSWINEDELGGKTMTKFVGLRIKTSNYLIDDGSEDKKAKGTKKWIIKRILIFEIIKTVQKQLNLIKKNIIYKKKKIDKDSIKKYHKEFKKHNKLIL